MISTLRLRLNALDPTIDAGRNENSYAACQPLPETRGPDSDWIKRASPGRCSTFSSPRNQRGLRQCETAAAHGRVDLRRCQMDDERSPHAENFCRRGVGEGQRRRRAPYLTNRSHWIERTTTAGRWQTGEGVFVSAKAYAL